MEERCQKLRQELRSSGKMMEVCRSSYRQNLFLDPIALHFLNLETSATRLARALLVGPWSDRSFNYFLRFSLRLKNIQYTQRGIDWLIFQYLAMLFHMPLIEIKSHIVFSCFPSLGTSKLFPHSRGLSEVHQLFGNDLSDSDQFPWQITKVSEELKSTLIN